MIPNTRPRCDTTIINNWRRVRVEKGKVRCLRLERYAMRVWISLIDSMRAYGISIEMCMLLDQFILLYIESIDFILGGIIQL